MDSILPNNGASGKPGTVQGVARPYAWAADGRLIFEQGQDIGVLTMEGERTVEMLFDAEFTETEPALSPDGRWLAYESRETGTPLIYVQPFPNIDDGQWNVSLGLGLDPVWSPDGRELFYRNATDLMVAQVETGCVRQVVQKRFHG